MDENQDLSSQEGIVKMVYALQAVGLFIGLTFLVGVIINYVKRSEAYDTWLYDHNQWQIRTFWYSWLWIFVATIVGFGGFALGAALDAPETIIASSVGSGLMFFGITCWLVYRVVKGWMRFNDGISPYGAKNGYKVV